MEWNAIQYYAKAKGYLVFAIDQGQTAVTTQPGPWGSASSGNCIGLATNWISLSYMGKNFPIVDNVCDNPPWQATQAQNLSDSATREEWSGGWKAAVVPFQCTLSSGLCAEQRTKPSFDFLWATMSQSHGCYGVSLMGKKGIHAIALRHEPGCFQLFDANYFHIAVDGQAAFGDYVDSYFRSAKYDRLFEKMGIVGIMPPINAKGWHR